jgi:hypothetical protein
MSMRTAKEIHDALDGLRDNSNPGLLAAELPPDSPLAIVATILAQLTLVSALGVRAQALILELLEERAT